MLSELLAEVIGKRIDGVAVELELRARPRVEGQPRALALAIDNLIDNAVGASPRGGLVRVRLAAEGNSAVIDVIDQGPGVPPAVREHLFQPFQSTRPDGAGLGLTATMAIALAHRGTVELMDAPTTIRLRLPSTT